MTPPKRVLPSRSCKRQGTDSQNVKSSPVPVTIPAVKPARNSRSRASKKPDVVDLILRNHSKTLLKIFSEEIWVIILDLITSSRDFESVCNASPFFRNLLLPKRTRYLFPRVWTVLAVQYHRKHDFDSAFNQVASVPTRRKKSDRQSSKERWFSGILKCRLVCKTWNQVIDNFYQCSETVQNQVVRNSSDWVADYFPATNGQRAMSNFIRHFKSTHNDTNRNPFFGRKLHINHKVDSFYESEHSWNVIGYTLQMYGQHIWNFTLQVMDAHPKARIDCYLKIRQLLEFTPNLKVLNIQYTRTGEEIDDKPEHLNNLLKEINSNSPMPTLANLNVLVTKDLLSPVFHEILRANSHVSSLQVVGQSPLDCDSEYEIANVQLPNMKKLSIKIHSSNQRNAIMMPGNHWSLQKLKLDFGSGFFVDWPLVFAWIHDKGATTLTDLEIVSPKSESLIEKRRIMKWSFKGKLNLTRMKQLKLEMSNLSTLDFLLPLKDTLEYLTIQVKFNMGLEMTKKSNGLNPVKTQKVEFVGFHTREKMLQSNVWQIFPKLSKFEFSEFYPLVGESVGSSLYNKWCITRNEWESAQKA